MAARSGPARHRGPVLARRALLRSAVAVGVGSPLLLSCAKNGTTATQLEIPSPDNPVRWPLNKSAAAIESGLMPEAGSTLRIYNYADYLAPGVIKQFEADYGVTIQLTTFNDADEALTKIASKKLGFDLYFPSYDSLGKLVAAELLRPLNNDYLDQPHQPVEQLRRPLVRRGLAVHDPLHDLQHRHRLARTTWCRRTSPRATTPTTSSGTRSTAATSPSSTTGTRPWR